MICHSFCQPSAIVFAVNVCVDSSIIVHPHLLFDGAWTVIPAAPFLSLRDDQVFKADFMVKLVREFCHKDNMIAVVVIHDLNLALRFCDRFLLLKDGQVYRHGDRNILDSEALRDVYGVDAKVVEIEGRHMVLVDE
mgnify:CR=1 FL=1